VRDALLLGARLVVGGYLAVHGAQKLFGVFGGPGLDRCAAGFEGLGLTPGRPMALLAGGAELGGGLLTATGAAHPAGPLAIMGTMSVAATTHRANGALAGGGGFELPLTNLAAAAALAAAGPGRFSLGRPLPRLLTAAVAASGGALAGVSLVKLLTAQQKAPEPQVEAPAPAAVTGTH
jgi:putative oxidoreductase